jgi:hypothetical protein
MTCATSSGNISAPLLANCTVTPTGETSSGFISIIGVLDQPALVIIEAGSPVSSVVPMNITQSASSDAVYVLWNLKFSSSYDSSNQRILGRAVAFQAGHLSNFPGYLSSGMAAFCPHAVSRVHRIVLMFPCTSKTR